ncbi:MAG: ATP-binding cassette domain-containing protein [Bilophila wadsworthia]
MSTENEGLLEVRDLKVHFPLPKKSLFGERSYVKAVDGVSFRVRKGTTFGIVGESGSGKTTIANAVMGLVGVSGGSIRLEGNELVGIPEDRLKALRPKYQIVFQDPYSSLNPRMRVGKIVQDPLILWTWAATRNARSGKRRFSSRSGCIRRSGRCSRTSFPEGSASASALAGRWRAIPN